MNTLFYMFSLVFALSEIFYLVNRRSIDLAYSKRSVSDTGSVYIVYFFVEILSYIWPVIGLLSSGYAIFCLILVFWVSKFVIYHISEPIYRILLTIQPFINIALYLAVLLNWITN